jgi:hypothetical protein
MLKQAVQVPQGDLFPSQAGLNVAPALFQAFDFAVPLVLRIEQRFIMLRLKAEVLHELDIEDLPFKKLRWNERQRAFLVTLDFACLWTNFMPVAGVMAGPTAVCAPSSIIRPHLRPADATAT